MARRVVVHIGLEKTGTTAIQYWLAAHQALLVGRDILYPHAGRINDGHHDIAFALGFSTLAADQVVLAALESELRQWQGTAILSSENFSIRVSPESLSKLRQLLGRVCEQAQIVVYYRPQAEWLRSLYVERKRWGESRDFTTFSSAIVLEYEHQRLLWRSHFGDSLIVRRYDRHSNVLEDFAKVVGLGGQRYDFSDPRFHQTPLERYQEEFGSNSPSEANWGWSEA